MEMTLTARKNFVTSSAVGEFPHDLTCRINAPKGENLYILAE